MMNYQEFIQAVIQEIEKLGIKKEALRKEVSLKNNGQKKVGLIFVREDAQICPVVYLESFYARYCSARETVDVLGREIYLLLQKNESSPNLCVNSSSSYVSPSMLPLSSGDLIEWSLVCHNTLSYQKFCDRHSNHYDHPEELHQSVE